MTLSQGKIVQIQGSVVDVKFTENNIPFIYEALSVDLDEGGQLILEVQKLLEGGVARCVAMDATDGLQRETAVKRTNAPMAKAR